MTQLHPPAPPTVRVAGTTVILGLPDGTELPLDADAARVFDMAVRVATMTALHARERLARVCLGADSEGGEE